MKTACIGLEGILAPCLWQEIGKVAGIPELSLCESHLFGDFNEAMHTRVALLKRHKLGIDDLHFITSMFSPLKGASAFVHSLQKEFRVIVVSELPVELGAHFTAGFEEVELICSGLAVSASGYLEAESFSASFKEDTVESLNQAGNFTLALGHLPSDMAMLRKADIGILYRPSTKLRETAKDLEIFDTFRQISKQYLSIPIDEFCVTSRGSALAGRHAGRPELLS